ncbi:MAG TPA: LamG-like jellyroll fold domain-containing protein [Phycisphaerae bacterium]|nr:LamG-like jellyroll fold domain-containing protein [Phycisphaerae bacterium]HUX16062.1 LamG-like jellyroll fold domain-containing protein [Phycisphaerae bacterium]
MLVFRVDEQNFGEGERDGVRIVTGQGLKVDFDELVPDGQTLGLWHLHDGACQGEGTGLADASGAGHHLTNHGAEPVENGYRFVLADGDYMNAAFASQPARSAITLESWVRAWQTPLGSVGQVAIFFKDSNNYLMLYGVRETNPASSRLGAQGKTAGGVFTALWSGTGADAFLASPTAWHMAGVLDSTVPILRLYVGGQLRASSATNVAALAAGDYTLRLGMFLLVGTYPLSAVLDEARLSAAARYAANFTPHRLLPSGAYAGPTLDAVRIQADWIDLLSEQQVPAGCAVSWDVRAADETDAFGHPQALWQPYGGDPATLPDGRYLQWRAALSATADRFTSPAITSVEASASEAGYDLYRGSGSGPESIDYAQAFARAGPGVREVQTEPLEAGTVHWFGIRPVDTRNIESPITQSEARIELDASGAPVPDRPAGALAIGAQAMPLGAVRLTWRYRPGITGVVPQVFRIFGDGGGGTIDYGSPLGEVAYEMGRVAYAATVEGLASGVEHQLAVRAVAQGEVWDEQPATAPVTPDADAPGEVATLEAEVVL